MPSDSSNLIRLVFCIRFRFICLPADGIGFVADDSRIQPQPFLHVFLLPMRSYVKCLFDWVLECEWEFVCEKLNENNMFSVVVFACICVFDRNDGFGVFFFLSFIYVRAGNMGPKPSHTTWAWSTRTWPSVVFALTNNERTAFTDTVEWKFIWNECSWTRHRRTHTLSHGYHQIRAFGFMSFHTSSLARNNSMRWMATSRRRET